MDILFLSVSAGGGHLKAAEAIKECVEAKYPHSNNIIVDTLRYVNPIVDKLIVGSYLNTVKTTPNIYGLLYDLSESGDNMNDFSKTVNKLLSYRIKILIEKLNPSIIVCTHPSPLQMLSNLKRKGKVRTPTIAILTDYVTHPFWIHDHIEAYVVAHKYMKYQMIKRGVSANIIFDYGIPVSKRFIEHLDRENILKEMSLDNKQTILIMGGSLGFGEIRESFMSLLNCKKDLQLIVVTGKNLKLKKLLEKKSQYGNKKVKILSYTNKVAELMEISDFIITKPGGITIAESLIKELPMFLSSPIPGQEERNAQFLINNGVACRILANDSMDSILYQVMDNPLRVKHMKEMAGYLAKPDSCENIVNLLENLAI